MVSKFSNKKEAVHYLMEETGLSKQECSDAYDLAMKLDFDKIKR